MPHTKKHMVEDYERLYAHADLLELYLYDTQQGRKPDATEVQRKDGKYNDYCRVQLWRGSSAHGGYVVILKGNANVWYLDDINRKLAEDHSVYSLPLRLCLERVTVERNRLQNQQRMTDAA